jgi:hypothetical protein
MGSSRSYPPLGSTLPKAAEEASVAANGLKSAGDPGSGSANTRGRNNVQFANARLRFAAFIAACGAVIVSLIVTGQAQAVTWTHYADREAIVNSDGTWVVYTNFDQTFGSRAQPGAVAKFHPAGWSHWMINDVDDPTGTKAAANADTKKEIINDPRYGGIGGFGFFEARRYQNYCCDLGTDPGGRSVMNGVDIGPNNAWSIDGLDNANAACCGSAPNFGVASVNYVSPIHVIDSTTVGMSVIVNFRDQWVNPVMSVRYDWEFYDGAAGQFNGGARLWLTVTQHAGTGIDLNYLNAFLGEVKNVISIAPSGTGAKEYKHMSLLDVTGAFMSSYNVCDRGASNCPANDGLYDALTNKSPSSYQVRRAQLDAAAATIRFDDNDSGCDTTVHRCFYASYEAYPTGSAPHASRANLWDSSLYGWYAWGEQSEQRACFARYGADPGNPTPSSCNPPLSEGTFGGAYNNDNYQGLPLRWEIHKQNNYVQLLVPNWEHGNGAYDVPIDSRAFGADGESWSVYENFTYGPGKDLQ